MTFAERVYKAVKQIPKGKVLTYAEVAKRAGRENAYRAVGNTLNKNPHLVAIPCHRVVRSDGRVGGYALGAKKKMELLKEEGIEIKKVKLTSMFMVKWSNG